MSAEARYVDGWWVGPAFTLPDPPADFVLWSPDPTPELGWPEKEEE